MIVTFCGHSDYVYGETEKSELQSVIEESIKNGATEFWLGGYGSFDLMCAHILQKIRQRHGNFKIILVIPYMDRQYDMELYDYSIYPPIEHIPLRFAISERNKWMVANSDLLISGVRYNYGGASKTLSYAKRLNKKIISV